MKALVAGLLAAAALVPTAMAQDASLRDAFRQRMEARGQIPRGDGDGGAPRARPDGGGWQRAERPDRARVERPRPEQARPDRPGPDRPGPDRPGPDRPDAGWQRPDRPAPVPQANRDPRDGRPLWTERNWRGDQDRRAREANRERWDRRGVAGDWDRRGDDRRDWNGRDGRGRDWDGRDWNRGDWNRRDSGWNDRRDWGRDDRRGWNRGWRTDPRYDWNRYRVANRSAFRLPRYYAPYGWSQGYRRFGVGVRLSSVLFAQNYWIDDPFSYRLPDPYGPYRWVRYYDDALLVDVYTGQVIDVVYGLFW